ncbi:hypothetical protein PF001_g32019 [Phytophthora fragariae]|uniref:Secreted protein n=1 Tax=Phytophthora fragariae TaxID=53985 RepID=A0A6A4AWQ9_9STRA|nr:hypothetical protein PF011_g27682 [Phytophthora fragariae]KAE9079328.1 hypothetical protein PF006_g27541 [Phytophthora fragariae]KAE9262538.1 hypothetical protein PF001_g32019 [Phytophthora fragariae]
MHCSFGIFFHLLLRANCSSQAVQSSVAPAVGTPHSSLSLPRATVFPVAYFVCICELVPLAIGSFIDGANNYSSSAV